MNLYTIGFTQKTAEEFFTQLKKNKIQTLIDIRLNNKSQLAGFTKGSDLKFFLKEICDINYIHDTYLSPTEELLKNYKNNKISWLDYEMEFKEIMQNRDVARYFQDKYLNDNINLCLLCSEPKPEKCHRRLVAEYVAQKSLEDISIIHL